MAVAGVPDRLQAHIKGMIPDMLVALCEFVSAPTPALPVPITPVEAGVPSGAFRAGLTNVAVLLGASLAADLWAPVCWLMFLGWCTVRPGMLVFSG